MVNFENGTLVKGAYVIIDGKEYEVHMPKYEGKTPISEENLNKLQYDLNTEIINLASRMIYSTEEIVVGKWIDGKSLYKKTLHLTSGWKLGSETKLNHNISDVNEIIKYECFYKRSDNSFQQVPNIHTEVNWGSSLYDINANDFKLYLGDLGNNFNIKYINVTFYYTKTTE